MVATCSGPSSWVTPIRASRPSPSTAPTTSPSTSTWTPSTLCRTARIPRWYVRRDAGGPQDRPRSGAHDGIDATLLRGGVVAVALLQAGGGRLRRQRLGGPGARIGRAACREGGWVSGGGG